MSRSFNRKIQTLKLIGSSGNKKGLKEIHKALLAEGFDIDIRSLQRDINALAESFEIENDGNKDQPGWFWKKEAKGLNLPGLTPSVALTFKMAEHYLKKVFPRSTLDNLNGYFNNANRYLKSLTANKLALWDQKVAIISRKQPFIIPEVDESLLAKIYDGLLKEKQLDVIYQPKYSQARDYTINPLGIVMVDEVIYLVGTLWKYSDIRQFALHRFIEVENSDNDLLPAPEFDLQRYTKEGGFGFPIQEGDREIELTFKAPKWIAEFSEESALSADQTITDTKDGSARPYTITATVLNTAQLRWWLSHYVANIEIIAPLSLREEFKANAKALGELYGV